MDKALAAKGISLSHLHRLTGISVSHLSLIANGKRRPSLRRALELSRALDISLDHVASWGGHTSRSPSKVAA